MSRKTEARKLYEQGWSKRQIAEHFGVNPRTVRNWIPARQNTVSVLPLIDLIQASQSKEPKPEIEVQKLHADKRSELLRQNLVNAVTQSRYPVINPECIIVEPRVDVVYDQKSGETYELARSPRTYVSDILRVKPVERYEGKTFIFSRAQNATQVDHQLLKNIKAYAKFRGAQIVIGPDTYETAWWHETNYDCREYDPAIKDYLCFGRMEIGPNFFFAGEMNIMTTASRPISDLVSYSMGKWCVVPHSKHQLESIASTDPAQQAHQVLTTGSITIPKVVPRKAGIKSIFHHVMGFVIVEFDDEGNIFCRHVNSSDDGSFFDLWYHVQDGTVTVSKFPPDYIMPGDVHRAKLDRADQRNVAATFGFDANGKHERNNLISLLKPRAIILQDLHDGEVDNHHTANDNGHRVEMATRGRHQLYTELLGDHQFLTKLCETHPHLQRVLVDESNHDIRLERYVREGRYRGDGFNMRLGLQLEDRYLHWREEVAKALDRGEKPPLFSLYEYTLRRIGDLPQKIQWVYDGHSYVINGVEVGHHGFRGSNGSKATITGYARMGRRISYGDKHSPAILDGAFQAGVLALQQGYNKGPSGWAVSHIVQYANGKRTLITLQNGKFTNVWSKKKAVA